MFLMILAKFRSSALNDPEICLPAFSGIYLCCTVLHQLLPNISPSNKLVITAEMHSEDSGVVLNTSPVISCCDVIGNVEGFSLR